MWLNLQLATSCRNLLNYYLKFYSWNFHIKSRSKWIKSIKKKSKKNRSNPRPKERHKKIIMCFFFFSAKKKMNEVGAITENKIEFIIGNTLTLTFPAIHLFILSEASVTTSKRFVDGCLASISLSQKAASASPQEIAIITSSFSSPHLTPPQHSFSACLCLVALNLRW